VKNLSGIQQRISSFLLVQSCSLADTQESKGESLLEVPEGAVPSVIAAGDPTSGSGVLLPTLNGCVLVSENLFQSSPFLHSNLNLKFMVLSYTASHPLKFLHLDFFCSTGGCLATQ
jgi:hypothetical protein